MATGQVHGIGNGGQPAELIRVEPKQGGKIVEIGPDDTEHL